MSRAPKASTNIYRTFVCIRCHEKFPGKSPKSLKASRSKINDRICNCISIDLDTDFTSENTKEITSKNKSRVKASSIDLKGFEGIIPHVTYPAYFKPMSKRLERKTITNISANIFRKDSLSQLFSVLSKMRHNVLIREVSYSFIAIKIRCGCKIIKYEGVRYKNYPKSKLV